MGKNQKVGFIHTVLSLAQRFQDLAEECLANAEVFHIVDESLLNDLLSTGRLTISIVRRLCIQILLASNAGADLIMVTCSSTSPAVDTARKMVEIPVLKIDEPMVKKAIQIGNKVGVVATVRSTLEPSTELIEEQAKLKGKSIEVTPVLKEEAFKALRKGDQKLHDRLVKESAIELAKENDVVVLAQASMSHLAPEIEGKTEIPVLTSPRLAMKAIKKRVEQEERKSSHYSPERKIK